MGDVLTKEEDRKVRSLRERLRVQGGTMTADSFLVTKDESLLLSMVDRLVSEVERLRARNEALEKVLEDGLVIVRDYACGQTVWIEDALSALAEPGKGGER